MKISAIYLITNKINNKHYVGRSIDAITRLRKHKEALVKNRHKNGYLQNSVNKYGIESFEFELLEEHPIELLAAMECYWINILNTCNRDYGYNIEYGKIVKYSSSKDQYESINSRIVTIIPKEKRKK